VERRSISSSTSSIGLVVRGRKRSSSRSSIDRFEADQFPTISTAAAHESTRAAISALLLLVL